MIKVELSKLVRRPRTWVTIALLAGLPVVVGIFVKASGLAPAPGEGPALLSEVLNNGLLFPAAALAIILPLFLPIAVSVIGGDTIAGEASNGTLRYLLTRPVGRTHLLGAKLDRGHHVHLPRGHHGRPRRTGRRRGAVRHPPAVVDLGDRALAVRDLRPHGHGDHVHRLVDAGARRDRRVRVDPHRLAVGRVARHPGGVRGIAGARPDRGDAIDPGRSCRRTTG